MVSKSNLISMLLVLLLCLLNTNFETAVFASASDTDDTTDVGAPFQLFQVQPDMITIIDGEPFVIMTSISGRYFELGMNALAGLYHHSNISNVVQLCKGEICDTLEKAGFNIFPTDRGVLGVMLRTMFGVGSKFENFLSEEQFVRWLIYHAILDSGVGVVDIDVDVCFIGDVMPLVVPKGVDVMLGTLHGDTPWGKGFGPVGSNPNIITLNNGALFSARPTKAAKEIMALVMASCLPKLEKSGFLQMAMNDVVYDLGLRISHNAGMFGEKIPLHGGMVAVFPDAHHFHPTEAFPNTYSVYSQARRPTFIHAVGVPNIYLNHIAEFVLGLSLSKRIYLNGAPGCWVLNDDWQKILNTTTNARYDMSPFVNTSRTETVGEVQPWFEIRNYYEPGW